MNRDPKLEIAHVLFIDIVGYSKCATDEQSELLDALNEAVRSSSKVQIAEKNGTLIELPTGDGMALVFRDSPEAPAQAAIEITESAKRTDGLRLRMGIHSGAVNAVADVAGRPNVAGAGINLAQRIMDCGDAGHILLSSRAAEDLGQHRHWQPYLHDAGETEVKHGDKVHLSNFFGEGFGNPAVPVKLDHDRPKVAATWPRKLVPIMLAIATCAAMIAVALWLVNDRQSRSSKTISEKSIAVLPFENLSEDKGNAYFVDGIQDEILTRLAKVADLKVISRTSTQQFKSRPGDLSTIAKQLGVAHILEGSAQRSAGQVRVNVQLIKAATDTHLWAETYDRKLTDVFAVETEIATKIADTLRAQLTGTEHQALAARPTENIEAHELYLKGRFFAAKRTGDNLQRAIDCYKQALAKDPNYAMAYAGIANSYALLQEYSKFTAAEVFPKAHEAAAQAIALDNNLAEAHAALAFVLAESDLDYKSAQREFERAVELDPNSADAHYFFGVSVLAPIGQLDRALAEIRHAIALDPFSAIMNANLGYTLTLARRYPEAIAQLHKTVELDPSFPYTYGCLGLALWLSGDVPGAIAEYEKSIDVARARGGREYPPFVFLAHLYASNGQRDKALQMQEHVRQIQEQQGSTWAYGDAIMQLAFGEKEQAIESLERSYQNKETGVICYIKVDPLLHPLQGDPRFEALANKIVPPDAK